MNESRVDVVQLQRRDPQAWTSVLTAHEEFADVAVTAVTAVPLRQDEHGNGYSRRLSRYLLSLSNTSDPIPLVGKKTGPEEASFYRDLASELPFIAPRSWFTHVVADGGWVILEDVPNHALRGHWSPEDVDRVLNDLSRLHFAFWNQNDLSRHYSWLPHFIGREQVNYSWSQLRSQQPVYFDEGPAAMISEHALQHLGRLAPRFVQAANGLAVMRALGGWPGVIGESHLAAAADLLDDPLPMLEPLLRLPQTLIHGNVHKGHWHLTLFDERRLVDWSNIALGPAIWDLVSFQEQFDLFFSSEGQEVTVAPRPAAASEETIVDSYLLAMKAELGPRFDARQVRQTIPAARCLHILTTCFPYFATWYDSLPDKTTWRRVNRVPPTQLNHPAFQAVLSLKPAMRDTFQRFLQAYRML